MVTTTTTDAASTATVTRETSTLAFAANAEAIACFVSTE